MEGIKRWAPFVASVLVVAVEIAKAFGYGEQAAAVLRVLALFVPGIESADAALAAAAVTSAAGLVRQLVSRFQKARAAA